MTTLTRVEFIARVIDILRRSNVDDADYLIGLLEQHVDKEFDPGCGLKRSSYPDGDPCVLPVGHDGYHRDENGRGWTRIKNSSDDA